MATQSTRLQPQSLARMQSSRSATSCWWQLQAVLSILSKAWSVHSSDPKTRQRSFLSMATCLSSTQMTTRRHSTPGSRETCVHTETLSERPMTGRLRQRYNQTDTGKRRAEILDTLYGRCTFWHRQPFTHIYLGVTKEVKRSRKSLDGFSFVVCNDRQRQREWALCRV